MATKPSYQPKMQYQLDGSPTGGEDCAVRTDSMGADYETKGAKVPTCKDLRNRAGVPSGGWTTQDMDDAITSYDTPNETNGYTDLTFARHNDGAWADLADAIFAGRAAGVFVDYGWVNDHVPELSGDKKFRGTHAVLVCGWSENDPGPQLMKVWDPLNDGRRDEIPKGPVWYTKDQLRKATGAVIGDPDCKKWRGGIYKYQSRV